LVAFACSGDGAQPGDLHYGREAGGAPQLENDGGPETQGLRLMSVDELAASVSTAAGLDAAGAPIRWEVDIDGQGPVDAYSDEAFGRTLGRPDYVTVTEESAAPSTLYAKLARDMARDVCGRIVAADVQKGSGQTLWRFASYHSDPTDAELTENLRYLMLRFWGQPAAAGDAQLESLRQVYHASRRSYQGGSTTPQIEGWRGVCIALLEDPAFHIH
jgi:hypothetical protein